MKCKSSLQPCVLFAVMLTKPLWCRPRHIRAVEQWTITRVALETRNKECDYAGVASDLALMDSVPSVILEVAVFKEDETEPEAEGSEWMDLLQVQVGPSP